MTTEEIKKGASKGAKNALVAITAKSKKVVTGLIFLTLVILDTTKWDHTLFKEGELLKSNVFVAIAIFIAVITVKDIQSLINKWIDKKLN